MKVCKIVVGLLATLLSSASMAGVILSEGFDDLAAMTSAGWQQQNLSSNPGSAEPYFQGNADIFEAAEGPSGSYVATNFTGGQPSISSWLITPVFSFASLMDISFLVRVAGGGYLDTLKVYLSSSGSSTDVADFTTLLGTYASDTDEGWVAQIFQVLGTEGQQGRLGFEYVVADAVNEGNYLGIDSLRVATVSPVPEPTSLALVGLALGCLAMRRRLQA